MKDTISDIIEYNLSLLNQKSTRQLDDMVDFMMACLLSTTQHVFLHMPYVDAPEWEPETQKLWKKHYGCVKTKGDSPWRHYIYL